MAMGKKPQKRAEVELRLCRSKETKKLYYCLMENGSPLKYWLFDDVSDAGRDLIGELINAFDLGYDIRCQFPTEDDGKKVLVPYDVKMYNEPGTKRNPKVNEKFYE